ncbi:NYN domain-containing protein [Paenibacillus sp. ACRRX]|uniref:NYN domain-containing protein n=1 Tax=unclassified Paenibacillus TaxID=185978 RepID=UPI001EF6E81F|nr:MULTISPECIES: NYN domain-containing protein [unclassified Paenibacillus]MCG7410654.1 NYN domain-containing protein [Paenibacillus sp. ACRRX]MDK8184151.1 NYN domain-containing protein [Paenibacillus sp. UMB4589-SE434]
MQQQADWRDVLLVDGYNMIGAWSELKKLADTKLEEARDRLLDMLTDYQAYSGRRVIAVFDAYRVPGIGATYKQGDVTVSFTKEKETADECIERLVRELKHRRRTIYVATSDMTEQNVIFALGALRVSARELRIVIEQARREVEVQIREQALRPIKRNPLEDKLSLDVMLKLERLRRGDKME